MIDWQPICEVLRDAKEVSLFVHTTPDGDTLGSALALLQGLQRMGKKGEIVSEFPVPKVYQFLKNTEYVCLPEQANGFSVAIAIDCADEMRMGERSYTVFQKAQRTVNIDHHGTNTGYADLNAVEGEAAATGELIYLLLQALQVEVDSAMAQTLLTALSTDTGHFAYDNTTPRTLCMAAELLQRYGEGIATLERRLYRMTPMRQVQLKAFVLSRLETYQNGLVCMGYVTTAEMDRFGATGEDAEGIIDDIRDIDTVDIGVFIRQTAPGKYKVSFRSKQLVDVSAVATRFQGGGHKRAAGCTVFADSVQTVKEQVLSQIAVGLEK